MKREELTRRVNIITEALLANVEKDSKGLPVPGSAMQKTVLDAVPDDVVEDILDPEVDLLSPQDLKKALGCTMILLADAMVAEQEATKLLDEASVLLREFVNMGAAK